MQASELFIPTLREDPGDADAASHRLLVRGGFIRQVSAGLWSFLPLGWRVHEKAVQIVREEMNAIGGQEMFMPVIAPAELWQTSGRYAIPELWKIEDRMGRPFVLAMTHEETITFHAREISSYRQLPQILYHFQTKVRDEPRPRAGLIRVREFIMKDSYSFDRDEEGLEREFPAPRRGAYHRIFERCGLEYYAVQAESGMMGGSESIDFLAPSGSGENTLVTCENGDYAADLEVARGIPRAPEFPQRLDAPEEVETPGVTTIEALADLLGIDAAATSKAMPVVKDDGTLVLALVRGDDRLEEAKTRCRPRHRLPPGQRGRDPRGLRRRPRLDRSGRLRRRDPRRRGASRGTVRRRRQPRPAGTSAASSTGAISKPASPTSASRGRATRARSAAAASPSRLRSRSGTSSSSGRHYSEPLDATFLDEDGTERAIVMGCYGIGPGRIMAAAVEQRHDEHGIAWPRSLAPYEVEVVSIGAAGPEAVEIGERVAGDLEAEGLEVLLDDRDMRPGEKFADADLIGCPVRITVGKKTLEDGGVDLLVRAGRADERVSVDELVARVKEVL